MAVLGKKTVSYAFFAIQRDEVCKPAWIDVHGVAVAATAKGAGEGTTGPLTLEPVGSRGRRGAALCCTTLAKLLQDVICHKAGCDQMEALFFIKRWLPGSGDRCGGRKRRFKEAFVVEQPDDPHSQSGNYRLLVATGFLPSHSGQGLDSTTATVAPSTSPDLLSYMYIFLVVPNK
ncbi:uncharacterized protein LOC142785328 isoform X1 [Rhipicephalus microplus]|uniref:uncharacterized protein LOC142785328 isoform X1 n=1 Tax=Rhipicephalus microplus TaxID=6941 RepID=UPI003F6BCEF8